MFDKYSIAKTKFRQIGSGLGLYLTKKIVEAHTGNIFSNVIKDDSQDYDIYEFGFEMPQNANIKDKELFIEYT